MRIPELCTERRRLISKGKDFIVYELAVTAPTLPKDAANRIETWLAVSRKNTKSRLHIENYFEQVRSNGTKERVFFWEDNSRLASISGKTFELIASKSKTKWR